LSQDVENRTPFLACASEVQSFQNNILEIRMLAFGHRLTAFHRAQADGGRHALRGDAVGLRRA
jgi:hypothetical protein